MTVTIPAWLVVVLALAYLGHSYSLRKREEAAERIYRLRTEGIRNAD